MLRFALAAVTLAAMSTAAGAAMTGHLDDPPRVKPLQVQAQGQCPPGYHWEAEGYTTNGKYRPGHCTHD